MQTDRLVVILFICVMIHGAAAARADTIIAAGDHGFPPFEFIDAQGRAAGLNVDLLHAIAEEMGVEVDYQLGPWNEGRHRFDQGRVDVMALYRSDFRTRQYDLATSHIILFHEIFIRISSSPLQSVDDLAGKQVIVQQDAFIQDFLLESGLNLELIGVETEGQALQLLADGNHDAAIVSEIVGRRYMRQLALDNLTTSGPPLFSVEYGFAVRQGNEELLELLNDGLSRIKASGRFNRIHERWMATSPDEPASGLSAVSTVLIGLALIAGLHWGLLIWRRRRSAAWLDVHGREMDYHFHHDSLTGLPNRAGLDRQLQRYLTGGRRAVRSHALLHVDLDQFSLVNASRDHQAGDALIGEIGQILGEIVGQNHFLARMGGDEFCVLLAGADASEGREMAERIRISIMKHEFGRHAEHVHITASVGVATLGADTPTVGELLKQAEAACLAAKESGRNRVHLYQPDDDALAQRHDQMRWVREVTQAIREDRLSLYYQTIEPADVSERQPMTAELLLRMQMPDGSLVAAGQFIPAAERYFIADRIDRWVIRHALQWLERHIDALPEIERIYINISSRSLGDDRFLPFVLEQFATHQVPPTLIGFEITETAVMTHVDTGLETIRHLRELGCRFALDDFGVGMSSMAYLKQLPVDVLKIDGSFSIAVLNSKRERAVLSEINDLGHLLGKTTVAEMVETAEVRQVMADMGIDLVQGWAISRPRPIDELLTTSEASLAAS